MKSGRHARILELISEQSIETQDDLLNCLKRDGYKATQATISRDIKDPQKIKMKKNQVLSQCFPQL